MYCCDPAERKKEIIEITWNYLLKKGLAHASIGDLCKETRLAQSSLYHWFENKDDIWISAGKYGLSQVVDKLIGYTTKNIKNVNEYFDTLLGEVENFKHELRLAVQITVSPEFGERIRNKANDFKFWYEQIADKLMPVFNCTYLQAETIIYSIIAYVIDYAIWDDKEATQMLLDNLRNRIINNMQSN